MLIENEDRKSDEYVSSVTHLNVEGQTYTEKISTANTVSGYHRWVYVDTAHVFAIVGYDVSTASYFVSTFSIMENNPQRYEDYSYNDGKYEDHQNGVIPFEIPNEIEQYVAQRICESDGIEVNELGVVTKYTGTDTVVIIPEYHIARNANGTISATKITGIDADTFKECKSQIVAVELSDYITEIPAHTFENCSSLIYVNADGVSKIGDYAFAGCSSLHVCNISDNITSLGAFVFDGMDSITVNASNANVAKAALQSGVKEINLTISKKCTDLNNTTLNVPASVTSFTFNGNDKTFTNVEIESNAAKTVISNATFVSDGKTPLKISSPEVELGQVRVNAAGIGLALSAPSTKLSLYGESTISSTNGRAMLCKSVTMSRDPESKNTTELKLTNGKLLLCGTMTDNGYMKGADGKALTNDKIEHISAADFDNYLKGVATITLNANGGTVSNSTLSCVYGAAIGTLPTPVWTYHTFTGWFTAASGGTKVTNATVCNGEMTLYAHWTENQWSDWSTTAPTGGDSVTVETKTQYRYRNKEYKNSVTQSYISGWTKTKEWVEYGSWSGNQTTTNRPSESSTLRIVNQYASAYNYYHYCCNWYNNSWCVDSIPYGNTNSTKYHTISVSSPLPAISFGDMGGKQCYGGSGSGAPACAQNFYIWFLDSVTYTYVYQTRSATTLYNHERWADWSNWSDSYRSGQDEQTRTMYRYRVK